MRHRRDFIAGTAATLGTLGTAPFAIAEESRKYGYVCPPCGCASDGKIFDAPGKCPSCGLTLISLEASEAMRASHAGDAAITFQSHGAMLAGAIVFPDATPPVAGLVLVHGSGKVERMLPLARLLAQSGFAVLTYDKRGVGMSGGSYEEMENVSAANLDLLADDAGAALTALQGNSRLHDLPVGFLGVSQAGWIIPIAATRSPGAKFIGLWSGAVCTTSEQLHFQNWAEKYPNFWKSHTKQQVSDYMRSFRYRDDDVDPRASLSKLSIPGLWLFGERDTLVPVDLSMVRLQSLKGQGHSSFEYGIIPGYDHNLVDTAKAPAFGQMVAWLKATTTKAHTPP
jgi:pimeloyl-ACP methyl ester carboxylesterase